MTSILPRVPKVVMTILEPMSLIAGAVAPFINAEWFVSEQIPGQSSEAITAQTAMIAYQLGNIYLLLAMVGVAVLYTTTEPKVVHNYVIALWLADIGHLAVTCWVMDNEQLFNIMNWNAVTWGNIGATVGLFAVRSGYMLGLFGPDCKPASKRQ